MSNHDMKQFVYVILSVYCLAPDTSVLVDLEVPGGFGFVYND